MNWWGIGFVGLLLSLPAALAVAAIAQRHHDVPPRLPVQPQRWRIISTDDRPLYDWEQEEGFQQD